MTANGDHEFSLDPCSPGSGDPATVIRGCGKSLSGDAVRTGQTSRSFRSPDSRASPEWRQQVIPSEGWMSLSKGIRPRMVLEVWRSAKPGQWLSGQTSSAALLHLPGPPAR